QIFGIIRRNLLDSSELRHFLKLCATHLDPGFGQRHAARCGTAAPAAVLAVVGSMESLVAASPVTMLTIKLRLASRRSSLSSGLLCENRLVNRLDAAAP
ncbi:hypothetical protein IFU20_27005, partial [Pseudomonas viridiflava]|uniref:hypothetical protein n=1 Tax=Pseudomonas viridiflava TaxID=33069 RepID=UPI001781D324